MRFEPGVFAGTEITGQNGPPGMGPRVVTGASLIDLSVQEGVMIP